TNLIELDA
nr:Chain Z, clathrin [Bos taurus]